MPLDLSDSMRRLWASRAVDPRASRGNRKYAQLQLENLDRLARGEQAMSYPDSMRDSSSPDWSSALNQAEHPEQLLSSEDLTEELAGPEELGQPPGTTPPGEPPVEPGPQET